MYYNHTVSYPAMHYCDMEQGVLYTFGEGMGYSHMEYVDICLKKQQDVWIISGIVKNKGNIDDTAVLQCYRKVLSGELVPRERELVAFSRIKVAIFFSPSLQSRIIFSNFSKIPSIVPSSASAIRPSFKNYHSIKWIFWESLIRKKLPFSINYASIPR